tara:strand:+ start:769 stop:1053 length:285 start_codon:yes stop_codon:yes gene_type:complete
MKIEQKSEDVVYITIKGWVYYIDDSTDEQIIQKWKNKYSQKDYEMFKESLQLSITAPNEKQSKQCLEIANEMSDLFPKNIIEKAKKEVEFYINN